MRGVMLGDGLCVGTDIKACGAVCAPEPYAADLVAVDITERVLVEDVFEVGCGVVRVEHGCGGNLADFVLVLGYQCGHTRGRGSGLLTKRGRRGRSLWRGT